MVKMVEKKPEKHQHLLDVIAEERSSISDLADCIHIEDPVCGECESEVTNLLDRCDRTRESLGPALFFLDQYGYSGFSMELVARILKHPMCETFSYLNWQRMHPYFEDPDKATSLTRALGGDEWRQIAPLQGQERIQRFRLAYTSALRNRAGAKFVYDFAMRDDHHQLVFRQR